MTREALARRICRVRRRFSRVSSTDDYYSILAFDRPIAMFSA
jgi:hypothetical protein